MSPTELANLLGVIDAVTASADDTGCTEDLTVTSASAIEALAEAATALRVRLNPQGVGSIGGPAQ